MQDYEKREFGYRELAEAILKGMSDYNHTEWEDMRVMTRSEAENMSGAEILAQKHDPDSTRYVVVLPNGTKETIRWRESERDALAKIIAKHYRWEEDE